MPERKLDIGWLRLFEAVGRLGSLTAAGAELGLSQPAVSYQIRRIEEQIGTALISRLHRGSRLTEAGETLFDLVWSHQPPPRRRPLGPGDELPVTSDEAIALSKALRQRGWKFVGPTIVYAYMQAVGVVDDHLAGCWRSA